jgi:putative nucleotidyltransferase with HDIG domain
VLTAKLLKIANSPFYGFPRRIATIDFAIVVLGFDALKDIVISVSLLSALNKNDSKFFDPRAFWDHCVAAGAAARKFSHDFNYRVSGEAFVAGLLHDIGILIETQYFPKEFREVIKTTKMKSISFLEAEKEIFGVTHEEIGSWLAERWNLPEQLVEAIRFHHSPGVAENNRELVALIHFVDVLSHRLQIGLLEIDSANEFDPEALKILNITEEMVTDEMIAAWAPKFQEEFDKTAKTTAMA